MKFTLLLLLFVLASFTIGKKPKTTHVPLPGVVAINDTLFADQTEITNADWLEYVSWNKHVFGAASNEYWRSLPDSTVWLHQVDCIHHFSRDYFRNPMYRDYPVVGITLQQAKAYAKWRSDRVFEFFLYKKGIVPGNQNTVNASNYFTIEGYFKGEYLNIKPDPRYTEYPEYRLPTTSEQAQMEVYNDSLMRFFSCKKSDCQQCLKTLQDNRVFIEPCNTAIATTVPMVRKEDLSCLAMKNNPFLYHLNGNVAEFSDTPDVGLQNNWRDNYYEERIGAIDEKKSPTIGFRCVAQLKTWKGVSEK